MRLIPTIARTSLPFAIKRASRSLVLVASFWFIASQSARSELDTNQNGISDLWEKAYNSDELFDSTFDPDADPDGDGWSNVQEAAAGTDPFDPNPPSGFLRPETTYYPDLPVDTDDDGTPDTWIEAVAVKWTGRPGKLYTLYCSPDLSGESWIPLDEPRIGDGTEMGNVIPSANSEKLFWRVAINDTDSDGDGLTDAEEHQIGTDPYVADTDQDGLSDGFEFSFCQMLLGSGSPPSRWGTLYNDLLAGNADPEVDYTQEGITLQTLANLPNEEPTLMYDSRENGYASARHSAWQSNPVSGIYSSLWNSRFLTELSQLDSEYLTDRLEHEPWEEGTAPVNSASATSGYHVTEQQELGDWDPIRTTTYYNGGAEQVRARIVSKVMSIHPRSRKFMEISTKTTGPGPVLITEILDTKIRELTIPEISFTSAWVDIYPSIIEGSDHRIDLAPANFKTYSDEEPGPDKAHIRNLPHRPENDPYFGEGWKKCVSKIWQTSHTLDLYAYLTAGESVNLQTLFEKNLTWKINGNSQNGRFYDYGAEPDEDQQVPLFVELLLKPGGESIDSLIVTILPRSTKGKWEAWYLGELNDLSWHDSLPPMFSSIETTVGMDGYFPRPDRNFNPYLYAAPHAIDSFYHPGASFEMRSFPTAAMNSHQACYDSSGILITEGVMAGSADKVMPWTPPIQFDAGGHKEADVIPFVWAAQLDGNPVQGAGFPNYINLSKPMLYQGDYLKRYLIARPPVPNKKTKLAPGATP